MMIGLQRTAGEWTNDGTKATMNHENKVRSSGKQVGENEDVSERGRSPDDAVVVASCKEFKV